MNTRGGGRVAEFVLSLKRRNVWRRKWVWIKFNILTPQIRH